MQPVKIVDCGEVEGSKIPSAIEKEKGNSRVNIRCKNIWPIHVVYSIVYAYTIIFYFREKEEIRQDIIVRG